MLLVAYPRVAGGHVWPALLEAGVHWRGAIAPKAGRTWEPAGYYPCDHVGSFARLVLRGSFLYSPEARGVRGRLWWLDEAFDASDLPDDEQLVHVRPVLKRAQADKALAPARKEAIKRCLDGVCGRTTLFERTRCSRCTRGLHVAECGGCGSARASLGTVKCFYCRAEEMAPVQVPTTARLDSAIDTMIIQLSLGQEGSAVSNIGYDLSTVFTYPLGDNIIWHYPPRSDGF